MTLSVLTGEPPKDGEVYVGIYCKNVRWKAYKKGAPQLKRGIKGRWQELTEYGGWKNCDTPGMYSHLINLGDYKDA